MNPQRIHAAGRFLLLTAPLLVLGPAQIGHTQTPAAPPAPSPATASAMPEVKGRTLLFAGQSGDLAANWTQGQRAPNWPVRDSLLVADRGSLTTKTAFTDTQIHLEFCLPTSVSHSRRQAQVGLPDGQIVALADSVGSPRPTRTDSGAIGRTPPLLDAAKPAGEWQTLDISYRAPRRDKTTHKIIEAARVSILLNGLVVQSQTGIPDDKPKPEGSKAEPPALEDKPGTHPDTKEASPSAPVELERDAPHPLALRGGNGVQFRNVWAIDLPAQGAQHY